MLIPRPAPDGAPTGLVGAGAAGDAAVVLASRTDPEAVAALFDRHAGRIGRYLARRLGEQAAADLVGETFLVAFRRRYAYDLTRADALPWLYGIATTLVGQHRREEARRHRLQAALPVEPVEPFPADRVAERVAAAAVRRTLLDAVAALRPADRDVLLLISWEQLSYEQVAAALDVPVGTVRSRLHRARRAVRARLGGVDPTCSEELS